MTDPRRLARRTFIADLGKGTVAIAVLSVAGCGPAAVASARPSAAAPAPSPADTPSRAASPSASALAWTRVNLGFVSAYLLVRGGEATIVDTGQVGNEDDIEAALETIGLGWSDVPHVVITHLHPDHAGSSQAVLELATGATGYAGGADLPAIATPRPLRAVGDGDKVFDLDIIATPGHTAGHIAVLDPVSGVLVAGDALRTEGGKPVLPDSGFSDDMDTALESVAKLGALPFEALLVGHGDPIESGAGKAVAALAASS